MRVKLLLISYYWPPSGGAGVQRWLTMSNYLQANGFDVTVVVPKNPDYPIIDEQLKTLVHQDIQIIKIGGFEPRNLLKKIAKKDTTNFDNALEEKNQVSWKKKLMVYIRGNYFIPDARILWARAVAKTLIQKKINFDVVLSSGPPHSLHLAAMILKNRFKKPWIADFRDPWLEVEYFDKLKLNQRSKNKHAELERKVLANADLVLTVSPSWSDLFKNKGAKKTATIFNGYNHLQAVWKQNIDKDKDFTLLHAGTLQEDRNENDFIPVLNKFAATHPNTVLKLIGNVNNQIFTDKGADSFNFTIKSTGIVSHHNAILAMKSASLLVLIQNNVPANSKGRIPMKFFEYLAANVPVLIIGDLGSDLIALAKSFSATYGTAFHDQAGIEQALHEIYALHKAKTVIDRTKELENFTREAAAKKVILSIQECIN
ncbi:MAG: glycosyltransferase [Crocinitomicaceae bacterium]|nr:glycosyltransferase [Crocinitomicaceae bacterium]